MGSLRIFIITDDIFYLLKKLLFICLMLQGTLALTAQVEPSSLIQSTGKTVITILLETASLKTPRANWDLHQMPRPKLYTALQQIASFPQANFKKFSICQEFFTVFLACHNDFHLIIRSCLSADYIYIYTIVLSSMLVKSGYIVYISFYTLYLDLESKTCKRLIIQMYALICIHLICDLKIREHCITHRWRSLSYLVLILIQSICACIAEVTLS